MAKDNGAIGGKAYIYGIREQYTDAYFYIGSTRHNPQDRFRHHLYQVAAGKHANRYFQNKVRKIGVDRVCMDIIKEVSDRDRWRIERDYIERYVANGCNLVNRIYNGVNFEISDYRFDFEEEPLTRLTPDRFWRGYEITRLPPGKCWIAPLQDVYEGLHELTKGLIDSLLERYPQEAAEKFGTYEKWRANRQTKSLC
jgi:hypothetical protein